MPRATRGNAEGPLLPILLRTTPPKAPPLHRGPIAFFIPAKDHPEPIEKKPRHGDNTARHHQKPARGFVAAFPNYPTAASTRTNPEASRCAVSHPIALQEVFTGSRRYQFAARPIFMAVLHLAFGCQQFPARLLRHCQSDHARARRQGKNGF